jgi:hypothetical protein
MAPPKKSKFWNLESTAEAGPSVAMPMDLHSSVRHLAINGQAKAILASSNNYPLDPCGKHTKNYEKSPFLLGKSTINVSCSIGI